MTKERKKYLVRHSDHGVIGHYEVCYQNFSTSAWTKNMYRRYACYRANGTLIGYETAKAYIAEKVVRDMFESSIKVSVANVVV